MGKVKSAIITALLIVAIVVLAFFATVSLNVPGSNGVKRYNSFISGIRLGSELTGEAYAILYPEGVISSSQYNLMVNNDSSEKDTYVAHEGVYVDKEKAGEELAKSIVTDAEIISKRLGRVGLSSYKVTVENGYTVKISIATDMTASGYNGNNTASRSDSLSLVQHTLVNLSLDGELSLRNGNEWATSTSLFSISVHVADYFKSIDKFSRGGTEAVRLKLTDEGFTKMNEVLTAQESGTAYFFVGETSLGLQVELGKALEDKTLYYTPGGARQAADYAVLLSSVADGEILTNSYNDDGINNTSIVAVSPVFGEHSAIFLGVALLVAFIAAIVAMIVKYKKLGLVNALSAIVYALTMIVCALLIDIEITIAGAFVLVFGLALLTFTNAIVFEAVRKVTQTGRTIQASVKSGYKNTLMTVLDLHVLLFVVALIAAIAGVGKVASCGMLLFVAVIASYVLYWFTRFMWYVISSPVRDKFKFCGYAREVLDDED